MTQQLSENTQESNDPATLDFEEGKSFLEKGSLSEAAMSFHNAYIEYEQNGNKTGMANCSDRLGDVCLARREFKMAASHYENSLAIITELNDVISEISLRNKMAQCWRELGQHDKAIETYLTLFDLYSDMRNIHSTVKTIIALAEVYEAKGDMHKASDAYRSAASIHANFKHKREAQKLMDRAKAVEERG